MYSVRGFILLTTLITIAVISLLLITGLQHLLLLQKAINGINELHTHFYHLETAARSLRNTTELGCTLQSPSVNGVIEQLKHHQGCHYRYGTSDLEYLQEDLGESQRLSLLSEEGALLQVRYSKNFKLGIWSWRYLISSPAKL